MQSKQGISSLTAKRKRGQRSQTQINKLETDLSVVNRLKFTIADTKYTYTRQLRSVN